MKILFSNIGIYPDWFTKQEEERAGEGALYKSRPHQKRYSIVVLVSQVYRGQMGREKRKHNHLLLQKNWNLIP